MKKIHLSIPRPCHEDWEAMTPSDKGRFCGSCQKTVIDFTNMSDRQLAEFFKRSPSSVCGRVHRDQLNRDIQIHRKRIPWVKYFFQFSLPAFLISMKAGAQVGKVAIKGDTVLVGKSDVSKTNSKIRQSLDVSETTNSIDVPPFISLSCTKVAINKLPNMKSEAPEIAQAIEGYAGGIVVFVGGISSKRISRERSKSHLSFKTIIDSTVKSIDTWFSKFSIYPNPVHRNSLVNIDFKKLDRGNYTVSIINVSGQLVQSEEIYLENKKQVIEMRIKDIVEGTYVVQVLNKKTKSSYSEKIIVNNYW